MIKLADQSELGWSIVKEYEADELADNSEERRSLQRRRKLRGRQSRGRKDSQMGSQLKSDSYRDLDITQLRDWVRALVVAKLDTFGNSAPNWYPCLTLPWLFTVWQFAQLRCLI